LPGEFNGKKVPDPSIIWHRVSQIINGLPIIAKNAYRKNEMKPDRKSLEDRLAELDAKIVEVKKRMPAHSIKPPIMMELFELEDERNLVEKQIVQLGKKTD
jgi:hypothetical protein